MFKRHITLFVFLSLMLGSEAVLAGSCNKTNLKGVWRGAAAIIDVVPANYNYVSNCTISFDRKGVFSSGSCTAVSNESLINGSVETIVGVDVLIEKACTLKGTITFANRGTTVFNGDMNSSKNVILGTGKNSTGGIGLISLLK